MVTAQLVSSDPVYRCLFPDWTGKRPLSFYLAENLLEARRMSFFPTNGAGPDEDVNIYLAHALTRFFRGQADHLLEPGSDPLLVPQETSLPRALRAERYRRNADHRLLCQGLFDYGELLRRRKILYGRNASETRQCDRSAGAAGYGAAASLLEGRAGQNQGLAAVLRKLELHYEDYAHVLAVLATRRLGLGARLTERDLRSLWQDTTCDEEQSVRGKTAESETGPLAGHTMDDLLDLLLEYHQHPGAKTKRRLMQVAEHLGVDPATLVA